MSRLAIAVLRAVLAVALAGSVFVQAVMVPLFWIDLDEAPAAARLSLVGLVFLGIVTLQVSAVCVWRLLTMVRRGTVFSPAAFRYVDVIFAAVSVASLLVLGIAVILAPGEIAPGVVLLVCGVAVVVAGVALIVLVLRMLLSQAVSLDVTAQHLRAELDEVI